MKFVAVVSTLLIASASAFAPASTSERATTTSLNMDRRSAMGAIAAAGVVATTMPGAAVADGAISKATIQRSKFKFGSRIAALKGAVAKGDFAAVAAEKNAFVLYNSGAYPGAKNKEAKKQAIIATNAIFGAIRAKDAKALQTAYAGYIKATNMSDYEAISAEEGQGYSSDWDYRVKTNQAVLWVR
ncbi:extrinsic protein in photosystem II [Fragilariopsis cylindrus CCMP1102]|uniref:Extrinsic protein in photosystem II n=1 Tax=Fragilariopsis cylindrus CCMP1102 TaxID=635003 RepID=A0A1E7FAF2_9STRA|nr:extrinsic protein in photosystem II [Fragilariopsis cylindrus CCMP1102]|eukprot:OEU14823.1 extrinsic protein in photosystem II [Fragilariopsis cylindrus CCMP1102]